MLSPIHSEMALRNVVGSGLESLNSLARTLSGLNLDLNFYRNGLTYAQRTEFGLKLLQKWTYIRSADTTVLNTVNVTNMEKRSENF
jgi:hypothetical protein